MGTLENQNIELKNLSRKFRYYMIYWISKVLTSACARNLDNIFPTRIRVGRKQCPREPVLFHNTTANFNFTRICLK